MNRGWLIGVSGLAIGIFCVALLGKRLEAGPIGDAPAFARAIEVQFWSGTQRRTPEPIVDPQAIAQVVAACVEAPSAIETCAARRITLVETFERATRDTDAMRVVAMCLTDGCGGVVPIAPANACLFWSLYFERRPDQVGEVDRATKERSCAQARFGGDDRRAEYVRLWNRSANAR